MVCNQRNLLSKLQAGKLKIWDCREVDAIREKYPAARHGLSAVTVAEAQEDLDDADDDHAMEAKSDPDEVHFLPRESPVAQHACVTCQADEEDDY